MFHRIREVNEVSYHDLQSRGRHASCLDRSCVVGCGARQPGRAVHSSRHIAVRALLALQLFFVALRLGQFPTRVTALLTPHSPPSTAVFSSSPTTPGALLFEYLTPTTYASSHPLAFLSEFQLHRRIHGIIGILDATEYSDKTLSSALQGFQSSLANLPKTFATKVYGFGPSEQQLDEGRRMKESEGLVMIPETGDVSFYMNTVLADFASEVLWEFSNMVRLRVSRLSLPSQRSLTFLSPPGRSTRIQIEHLNTSRALRYRLALHLPPT